MRPRRRVVLGLVLGLGLFVAQPAAAASPTAVLEAFFERANAILKTVDPFGDLEQPRQAIRELVNEAFDFRGASALALGPAWRARTPAEQDEFVRLFAIFLERGFIGIIGAKASVADGVKIQYVDETIGDEWAGVATSLLARNGQELPVDYWFVRLGQTWKVRDVVIDGVSLIANYRSQFTRVLGAYPYAEVIARLGGGLPEAPATVAAAGPARPPEPTIPAPRARHELALTAFPGDASSPELIRAAVAVPKSGIRGTGGPTSDDHGPGSYWVQLDFPQAMNAVVDRTEWFRDDGASVSKSRLPNVARDPVDRWARLRVGPFANRSDALAMLQELGARGQAALVAETGD